MHIQKEDEVANPEVFKLLDLLKWCDPSPDEEVQKLSLLREQRNWFFSVEGPVDE